MLSTGEFSHLEKSCPHEVFGVGCTIFNGKESHRQFHSEIKSLENFKAK